MPFFNILRRFKNRFQLVQKNFSLILVLLALINNVVGIYYNLIIFGLMYSWPLDIDLPMMRKRWFSFRETSCFLIVNGFLLLFIRCSIYGNFAFPTLHLIRSLFLIFSIPGVVWLDFKFLLAFLNVSEARQLGLVHVLSHVQPEVAIEQIEVDIDRVGRATAEVSFAADFQPVVDGEVHRLGDVESKVETLMVGRSAWDDELSLVVQSLYHLETLLHQGLWMDERGLVTNELGASLAALR